MLAADVCSLTCMQAGEDSCWRIELRPILSGREYVAVHLMHNVICVAGLTLVEQLLPDLAIVALAVLLLAGLAQQGLKHAQPAQHSMHISRSAGPCTPAGKFAALAAG